MLLYSNERLMPIAFAAVVAIASKYLFRVGTNGRSRHFFNPSNLGITATLLAFPWVGIAQPYMFTENLAERATTSCPPSSSARGSFLNTKFTKRMPLILAWLGGFVLQAAVRHLLLGTSFLPSLNPMTGVAFLLFTFYMVTDPATTPSTVRGQVAFGAAVAAAYGALMSPARGLRTVLRPHASCARSAARCMHVQGLAAQRAEARLKGAVPA